MCGFKVELKGLVDEDFLQYKKPSMFLIFPHCTFKCDIENGNQICQNWSLTKAPVISVAISDLINRYLNNPITHAVVCGGLEPLDSWEELSYFIHQFRKVSKDDIIIYTGYNDEEILDIINDLQQYPNIIIKFGRFVPGQKPHYDDVLGIELASDNQYARIIS